MAASAIVGTRWGVEAWRLLMNIRFTSAKRRKKGDGRSTVAWMPSASVRVGGRYLRCLLTSFVIANMLTDALPPKIGLRAASALIMRLFFLSCRPFFLM